MKLSIGTEVLYVGNYELFVGDKFIIKQIIGDLYCCASLQNSYYFFELHEIALPSPLLLELL